MSIIAVENLTFTYARRSEPCLKGISFAIGEGEIFGLLGPSGAGKTTTQKILLGMLSSYDGSVRVLERDARHLNGSIFKRVGVAFEVPALYRTFTARENLHFFSALMGGSDAALKRTLEYAAFLGLRGDLDRRVSDFSRGMKVRLNLCRAVVHGPDLLFLDEPTAGLDPILARRTRHLILELRSRGATVVLTTHNMALAEEICDTLGIIVDGRVPALGAPGELKRRFGSEEVEVTVDGAVRIFPLTGVGRDGDFASFLTSGNVERIRTLEANLDDVFLAVAGTAFGDADG